MSNNLLLAVWIQLFDDCWLGGAIFTHLPAADKLNDIPCR
jgi:hypothetical protein